MNKVYLLLRDNRETGPFTIDELIQQQLKPADLIWVEGKSVAWCYPYEMDELKAHVAYKPKLQVVPSSNPSMVSTRNDNPQRAQVFPIPAVAASYQPDEIEAKADQIRTNVISFAQQNTLPYVRTANTEPSSGGVWTNQERIQFVHHTRKKYVTLPQLIATGLITVLLASAWYGDWSTIRVKPNTVTIAAAPAAFNEEKPQPPVQTTLMALPDSQSLAIAESGSTTYPVSNTTGSANPVKKTAKPDSGIVQNSLGTALAVNTSPSTLSNTETNAAENEQRKENTDPVEKTEIKKEPVVNNTKPAAEPEKQEVTEEKEKKKKLGQVIKGIFKKKDKE